MSFCHGNRTGGTEMAQCGRHNGLVRLYAGLVFVACTCNVLEMAESGDCLFDTVYLVSWILFVSKSVEFSPFFFIGLFG